MFAETLTSFVFGQLSLPDSQLIIIDILNAFTSELGLKIHFAHQGRSLRIKREFLNWVPSIDTSSMHCVILTGRGCSCRPSVLLAEYATVGVIHNIEDNCGHLAGRRFTCPCIMYGSLIELVKFR